MSIKRGHYTKEEDLVIIENVKKFNSKDIAKLLNRTRESVYGRTYNIGLTPLNGEPKTPRILIFANTLYPKNNQQESILPVFKKFGRYEFLSMYSKYKKEQTQK